MSFQVIGSHKLLFSFELMVPISSWNSWGTCPCLSLQNVYWFIQAVDWHAFHPSSISTFYYKRSIGTALVIRREVEPFKNFTIHLPSISPFQNSCKQITNQSISLHDNPTLHKIPKHKALPQPSWPQQSHCQKTPLQSDFVLLHDKPLPPVFFLKIRIIKVYRTNCFRSSLPWPGKVVGTRGNHSDCAIATFHNNLLNVKFCIHEEFKWLRFQDD